MAGSDDRIHYFEPLKDHLVSVVGEATLDQARTILEFGSGSHGFIDLYARSGQRAIALDVSDYSDNYPDTVEFVTSDGNVIPMADESVDLIVSHSVVEHLDDVAQSFSELDRVLRVDGVAYITVSPLYYSPTGSHVRSRPDWAHLDPESGDFFMVRDPIGGRHGSHLNHFTLPAFLQEFGRLPWDFLSMTRKHVGRTPPHDLEYAADPLDLVTKEFRLVARKMGRKPAA